MSIPKTYISLRISGTPVRKGGFVPIVNINDAFFEMSDTYPSALCRDACLYSMCLLPDMTVYKLVFNRMRHHDDVGEARLVIGFSIPAGYRLPDGLDTAGVLHTLLEAFINNFAVALDDGSFEYRFGRFDTDALERICNSIQLVPTDRRRVVMNSAAPRGAAEVERDDIAFTLADTDNDRLSEISELLVAEHINTSLAGVAVTLRDDAEDTAATDGEEEEVSPETDMIDGHEAESAQDMEPGSDNPAGETYSWGNDNVEEDAPEPRRSRWPVLLAGVLIGAVVTFVAVGLFQKHTSPADTTPAPLYGADTAAVVTADTVAPVAAETVYVERRIIVKEPKARRSATVKAPATVTTAPVETPAQQEEAPAKALKYDPEEERSL